MPTSSTWERTMNTSTEIELDSRIAEYIANPKLGDPQWEREWADLLDERHGKTRVPTVDELACALSYIENEFLLEDGQIDGEQWAEGLAFGRYPGCERDKVAAGEILPQLSRSEWARLTARADHLAEGEGMQPKFARTE